MSYLIIYDLVITALNCIILGCFSCVFSLDRSRDKSEKKVIDKQNPVIRAALHTPEKLVPEGPRADTAQAALGQPQLGKLRTRGLGNVPLLPSRKLPSVPKWSILTHFILFNLSGHIDGSVQERCNSSALAMELRLSCTDPSICGEGHDYVITSHRIMSQVITHLCPCYSAVYCKTSICPLHAMDILLAQRKTVVAVLPKHWSYCSLLLSHCYVSFVISLWHIHISTLTFYMACFCLFWPCDTHWHIHDIHIFSGPCVERTQHWKL